MASPLIIVLGGGPPVSLSPPTPPAYVVERCAIAAQHYRALAALQPKILCLSSGTAHVPAAVTPGGHPLHESVVSACYLASALGIPTADLLVETASYDTVGNAWFARVQHLEWAQPAAGGAPRQVIVVTSASHMPRSRLIFDKVLSLPAVRCSGGGSDALAPPRWAVSYAAASNAGLSDAEVGAREEREAASARAIAARLEAIQDMQALYGFVTSQHDMYSAHGLIRAALAPSRAANDLLSDTVLSSYGGGGGGGGPAAAGGGDLPAAAAAAESS